MCEIPFTDKMREALKEARQKPSTLVVIVDNEPTKEECAEMIFKLATRYAMLCDESMTLADGNRVAYWTLEAMNSNTATGDMIDTDDVFDRLGEDV